MPGRPREAKPKPYSFKHPAKTFAGRMRMWHYIVIEKTIFTNI
jgi:hypothetical protein